MALNVESSNFASHDTLDTVPCGTGPDQDRGSRETPPKGCLKIQSAISRINCEGPPGPVQICGPKLTHPRSPHRVGQVSLKSRPNPTIHMPKTEVTHSYIKWEAQKNIRSLCGQGVNGGGVRQRLQVQNRPGAPRFFQYYWAQKCVQETTGGSRGEGIGDHQKRCGEGCDEGTNGHRRWCGEGCCRGNREHACGRARPHIEGLEEPHTKIDRGGSRSGRGRTEAGR